MENHKRVLIVEDDPLIAEDISESLKEIGYIIAGIAYDSSEAMTMLRASNPDIAVLDINLESEKDGIQIGEYIQQNIQIPFIYLTSYSDKTTLERAKKTRPMAYIVKPFDERDLYTALEIALFNFESADDGDVISLEDLNKKMLAKFTPKEYEIILQIMEGYANKQLAEANFVSLNTIKTHLKNIYDKLEVNSRTQVIVKMRELSKQWALRAKQYHPNGW